MFSGFSGKEIESGTVSMPTVAAPEKSREFTPAVAVKAIRKEKWCPERDSNPHTCKITDFKSVASAISPSGRKFPLAGNLTISPESDLSRTAEKFFLNDPKPAGRPPTAAGADVRRSIH